MNHAHAQSSHDVDWYGPLADMNFMHQAQQESSHPCHVSYAGTHIHSHEQHSYGLPGIAGTHMHSHDQHAYGHPAASSSCPEVFSHEHSAIPFTPFPPGDHQAYNVDWLGVPANPWQQAQNQPPSQMPMPCHQSFPGHVDSFGNPHDLNISPCLLYTSPSPRDS